MRNDRLKYLNDFYYGNLYKRTNGFGHQVTKKIL